MDQMRRFAYASILRACGFAALATFCLMFGTAFDLHLAFRAGAVSATIVLFALLYKADEALRKDYRKTEMWMMLPKEERPPATVAQRMTNTILHETYLNVAKYTALICICMWAVVLLLGLFVERS